MSLLIGCTGGAASSVPETAGTPEAGRRKIVATTGMVADLVRNIVGDSADVTSLMGAGADPHLYKPTRNDVRKLMDADLIVYSGLSLEHRLEETLHQIGRSGVPTIAVSDGIDPSRLRGIPGSAGQFDPHLWMDVSLWASAIPALVEALAKQEPARAEEFRERAGVYEQKLLKLDHSIEEMIASIPPANRVLVTAHDAFNYFSTRYKIEVRSVQGISTESEAGVQDVNRLVDFLVKRKLPAVFVETSVGDKPLQAVIEGCRSRGHVVKLGGQLYSDSMGIAGTYEGTYIGMLDANSTQICRALGGIVPEKEAGEGPAL